MALKLAILPGDGTGPEVVREALKVLAAVSPLEGFEYTTEEFDFGGDRYLASGHIIDDDDIGGSACAGSCLHRPQLSARLALSRSRPASATSSVAAGRETGVARPCWQARLGQASAAGRWAEPHPPCPL